MKGLLYKDWSLIAGGYKTNFLFLLVFYGLLTVAGRMTFSGLCHGVCCRHVCLFHHQHG